MKRDEGVNPTGIIAIDKPEGPTSHDIVRRVRWSLQTRRVGHCGTLDPLATGLMLICVGKYTRLSDWLTGADKQYVSTFHLGATSTTADAQGEITAVGGRPPSLHQIEDALAMWRGVVEQIPPAHSAIKVDGVRSYKRARRQEEIDLPARTVTLSRFDVLEYEYPHLRVHVECSKGTYIRALARDVGEALGCGAYVRSLRRTHIGSVDLSIAVALDEVERVRISGEEPDGLWLDPIQALRGRLPLLRIAAEEARDFTRGLAVHVVAAAGEVIVCVDDQLLGVGRVGDEQLQPVKVLSEPLS